MLSDGVHLEFKFKKVEKKCTRLASEILSGQRLMETFIFLLKLNALSAFSPGSIYDSDKQKET